MEEVTKCVEIFRTFLGFIFIHWKQKFTAATLINRKEIANFSFEDGDRTFGNTALCHTTQIPESHSSVIA
jgi:hypothetical protein